MRVLILTNMYPSPERPALGSFVADQVEALRRLPGVDLELFTFAPGSALDYLRAAARVRRRYRRERFDVVHAHFGLTAWIALATSSGARVVTLHGTDLADPRSRAITLAALRFIDLVATVSEPLAREVPRALLRREIAILPCGVDVERFKPIPRAQARTALDLDPDGPFLLFPADPERSEKRHDRALAVAGEVPTLVLRSVPPARVPLWVNAANAVLIPSDREGFGLAALEALACDVPVLCTPVGIAPAALDGIAGSYCGRFEVDTWRAVLAPHLRAADPRIEGRARAEQYSSQLMAARVMAAWRDLG